MSKNSQTMECLPDMPFGRWLAQKRKELKMNQTQFAEIMGVSRTAVSAWEVGSYNPAFSVSQIHTLCETLLGVELKELPKH